MFQLINTTLTLNKNLIQNNLNCTLPPSGFVGLLGPNGIGKTTLLRTLGGMIPHEGEIFFKNKSLHTYTPSQFKNECAYYAAIPYCAWNLTVLEIITMGKNAGNIQAPSTTLFQIFNMDSLLHKHFESLSQGQKTKVMLVRTFNQNTPVILLDEPTSALDAMSRQKFMGFCANEAQQGKLIFAAMHDIHQVNRFCDHAFVLSEKGIYRYQLVKHTHETGRLKKALPKNTRE